MAIIHSATWSSPVLLVELRTTLQASEHDPEATSIANTCLTSRILLCDSYFAVAMADRGSTQESRFNICCWI